jgi:hypothetical protein
VSEVRGPLIEHIASLSPKERQRVLAAIQMCMTAPDGAILLKTLEDATHGRILPISADPRALSAVMAQRFIAHDLRRLANADPHDPVLAPLRPKPSPRSGE